MTALTVYFTVTAATTITTANTILENATTGATTTSKNTTVGTSTGWGEIVSQSTANPWGAGGSAPAPSGLGFIDDGTTFPTQQFIAGSWTATIRLNTNSGTITADIHVRAYRRTSGGVYTLIADMVATGQSITTTAANYTPSTTTGTNSVTFGTGDKLYCDVIMNITGAGGSSTVVKLTQANSSTQGSTNAQIVTPGYQTGSTLTSKDVAIRGRIRQLVTKDVVVRGRIQQLSSKDVALRGRLQQLSDKDLVIRGRIQQLVTKDLVIRGRIQQLTSKHIALRGNVGFSASKDLVLRARIQQLSAKDIALRGRIKQLSNRDVALRGRIQQLSTRDLALRGRIQQLITHDVGLRGRIRQLSTRDLALRGRPANTVDKDVALRGRISTSINKDIVVRGRIKQLSNRDVALRGRIQQLITKDVALRGRISSAPLVSGGFTLFANGTGTVSYDHFRVTQYPDPALSLSPVRPRVGTTLFAYNVLTPAHTNFGADVSLDGVNWTDLTAGNNGSLPGIYSQVDPVIDGFDVNTSANYLSTSRSGGTAATVLYDTAFSRLVLTGGTNAIYVSTLVNRADVDFFADLDQSDAGGLVWRFLDQNNYYWLDINDSLTSIGSNTMTLFKVAANVQTQLGTAALSYIVGTAANNYTVTFTRGTYRRFRVSMLMGVITVYVDGNILLTYTDSSPLGAGLVGLYNNGGVVGSRYYQLWIQPIGDYVTGTPVGDIVTGDFVYTRQRLATTDPTVSPQVLDVTTMATSPTIGAGVSVPSIAYNASIISKNIDDLAKQSNYSWYIDANKVPYFRSRQAQAAPWIVQSSTFGLVVANDLEVDSNLELDVGNDLYRNREIIIGATDTATITETMVGDGSTRSWTLGYPLASQPSITLNGMAIAATQIGLKGTTGSIFYYAVNDPVITQDASQTVLQASDQLSITYSGLFPVTVTIDDLNEQASRAAIEGGTGIVEDVMDVTGQGLSKAAAITLANQLIDRYGIAGRTLIFDTTRNGLAVGQLLSIFVPEHGIIDGQFFITQVEISLMQGIGNTQVWTYKVTASELPKQASWAKLLASGLGIQ